LGAQVVVIAGLYAQYGYGWHAPEERLNFDALPTLSLGLQSGFLFKQRARQRNFFLIRLTNLL